MKPADQCEQVTGGDAVVIQTAVRRGNIDLICSFTEPEFEEMRDGILHIACREPYGYKLITNDRLQSVFTKTAVLEPITKSGLTPLMIAVKYR